MAYRLELIPFYLQHFRELLADSSSKRNYSPPEVSIGPPTSAPNSKILSLKCVSALDAPPPEQWRSRGGAFFIGNSSHIRGICYTIAISVHRNDVCGPGVGLDWWIRRYGLPVRSTAYFQPGFYWDSVEFHICWGTEGQQIKSVIRRHWLKPARVSQRTLKRTPFKPALASFL